MKVKITYNNVEVEYEGVDYTYDLLNNLIVKTIDSINNEPQNLDEETFKLTEWTKTPQQH